MAIPFKPRWSEARIRTIYARQTRPSWDAEYLPGILATREEAPSISHASILTPVKFGREVHLLSLPEQGAALLGFYHPQVLGLQEQRMIPGQTVEHPLSTFPDVDPVGLPPLPGLDEIAEELRITRHLTRVKVTGRGGNAMRVTAPWFGDLLWVLRDRDAVRCLNWTVKITEDDFRRRGKKRIAMASREDDEGAVARHAGERLHYSAGRIPTVQICGDQLDSELVSNLKQLFLHHRRELTLSSDQKNELKQKFMAALELDIPPFEVVVEFSRGNQLVISQAKSFLFQLIWQRDLRVDLFSPIHVDRPLRRMGRDPIDVYSYLFSAGGLQ